MKTILTSIIFLIIFQNGYSQSKIFITGIINNKSADNDSISFVSGFLNPSYYENPKLSTKIENDRFTIKNNFSYPQMFNGILKNRLNKNIYLKSLFFFDPTSTSIQIDTIESKSYVLGKTGTEYTHTFIPFFVNAKNNDVDLNKQIWDSDSKFDLKLATYVKTHPNSYVALWHTILRFNLVGYSDLRFSILNSFSNKIKSEKLWKITNSDFEKIKIKENYKFPELLLKNIDLKEETLILPKAEYTLIDFWFSRCRPCLEQMPSLIEIYNKNIEKGFNVIGISIDRTENIELYWKKRIIEKRIPWKNFLDENGIIATQEKIISFPTNFLLNSKGEVIGKNISVEDLKKFLEENLK